MTTLPVHRARLLAPTLALALTGALLATSAPAAAGPRPSTATWPVTGAVLRTFDPPDSPYGRGHRGVDLAAPVGAVVRAASAGRVTFAGMLAGRGVVVVDHGDVRTTYEPVSAVVEVGARMAAGQPVGRLSAGQHCGPTPCLHWGLIRGRTYLDPLTLAPGPEQAAAGPVRLLPASARARARGRAAGRAAAAALLALSDTARGVAEGVQPGLRQPAVPRPRGGGRPPRGHQLQPRRPLRGRGRPQGQPGTGDGLRRGHRVCDRLPPAPDGLVGRTSH